jgi:hypothetical protein
MGKAVTILLSTEGSKLLPCDPGKVRSCLAIAYAWGKTVTQWQGINVKCGVVGPGSQQVGG